MNEPRDARDTAYSSHSNPDGSIHHTWFDGSSNRRMSWDTRDDGRGNQEYIDNTGHETNQRNNNHRNWD